MLGIGFALIRPKCYKSDVKRLVAYKHYAQNHPDGRMPISAELWLKGCAEIYKNGLIASSLKKRPRINVSGKK